MATTIQIADKPTLTEVLNIVKNIQLGGGVRYNQSILKKLETTFSALGTYYKVIDVSGSGEFYIYAASAFQSSGTSISSAFIYSRITIDNQTIDSSGFGNIHIYQPLHFKFTKNFKLELKISDVNYSYSQKTGKICTSTIIYLI